MEIFVLVLSMLMADNTQDDRIIRGFHDADECQAFIPAYQDMIGHFDIPNDIKRAKLWCTPHTIKLVENSND